jgi:hypothetical protein
MPPIFLLKRDFLQDIPYIYTRIIIKQMSLCHENQNTPT